MDVVDRASFVGIDQNAAQERRLYGLALVMQTVPVSKRNLDAGP
jgi:hypothetical protein